MTLTFLKLIVRLEFDFFFLIIRIELWGLEITGLRCRFYNIKNNILKMYDHALFNILTLYVFPFPSLISYFHFTFLAEFSPNSLHFKLESYLLIDPFFFNKICIILTFNLCFISYDIKDLTVHFNLILSRSFSLKY